MRIKFNLHNSTFKSLVEALLRALLGSRSLLFRRLIRVRRTRRTRRGAGKVLAGTKQKGPLLALLALLALLVLLVLLALLELFAVVVRRTLFGTRLLLDSA